MSSTQSQEVDAVTSPRSLLGPALVIIGASMWGLETLWRVRLAKVFDPDILVFHEHWLGVILTAPFLVLGFSRLSGVSRKGWLSLLGSGVLGSALGTVCFTEALTLLNSSLANLLLNVQPVVSVLVTWFWLHERPRRAFYPWAALALLCGVRLAWGGDQIQAPRQLIEGLLFITGTAFCWGASTTFGRAAMLEIDFKTAAALRYIIGAVATFMLAEVHGSFAARAHWAMLEQPQVIKDFAALLIVAAVTPLFIYFAGLARTRASVATFAEMAQTFAALFITWYVLGDALTPIQVAAGVVLLVAVAFINQSVDAAPSQPAHPPQLA